jgi:hypothetical protein
MSSDVSGLVGVLVGGDVRETGQWSGPEELVRGLPEDWSRELAGRRLTRRTGRGLVGDWSVQR